MQIAFVAADNLGGIAIRAFEGGQASHCGLLIGGDDVIDATFRHGVALRRREQFERRRRIVEVIDVPLPDERAAVMFALEQVGKPYDWTAIVGFMGLRDWSSDRRWYCSELCASALIAGGLTIADRGTRFGVRLLREVCHARRV